MTSTRSILAAGIFFQRSAGRQSGGPAVDQDLGPRNCPRRLTVPSAENRYGGYLGQ